MCVLWPEGSAQQKNVIVLRRDVHTFVPARVKVWKHLCLFNSSPHANAQLTGNDSGCIRYSSSSLIHTVDPSTDSATRWRYLVSEASNINWEVGGLIPSVCQSCLGDDAEPELQKRA